MDSNRLDGEGQTRLENLADRFGREVLAARLGLSEEGLDSILSGYYQMSDVGVTNLGLLINALEAIPAEAGDDEALFGFEGDEEFDYDFDAEGLPTTDAGMARFERELGLGVGGPRETDTVPDPSSVDAVATTPGAGGAPEAPVGVDINQDGKPDFPLYGIDLSSRSGMAWVDQQDRRRMSLRGAHAMATMAQFRIGMTRMETVTALGLVTQIELALITYFRESLPEPGQNWDAQKRAREIERRLARLRWVEQQQSDEYSGWKGVWNRVRGRKKPSGKDLYRRMIENADAMVLGMGEPDRDDDVLAEALRFTGVGPEDPSLRELLRRPGAE